jgi:hypothetical protein
MPDRADKVVFMSTTNVYDRYDAPQTPKRDWAQTAQIAVLSAIVLVFFAIAAGSALALLGSVIHH